jgi:hypothetical protein
VRKPQFIIGTALKKIVLISCVSKKAPHRAKAKDLYLSPLFVSSLRYARSLKPDCIFILSAKHGLLELDTEIEPYDTSLMNMTVAEVKVWAARVLEQLRKQADLRSDHFIFLAGERYRQYLANSIISYEVPLKGLSIGKQLQYLASQKHETICNKIHVLFASLPKFGFPFDANKVPQNGIYILFENGEFAHGVDRIVRVGTHTGNNQLRSRLEQHFLKENKDRSIFRKNIGRAILNRDKDSFLAHWQIDLTTSEAKRKYESMIDRRKLQETEKQVTNYIQCNFRFVVHRLDDKASRLLLESKIISTVSLCDECSSSEKWLGLHSPVDKIRESGLWLVNELYKQPLSQGDYEKLKVEVSGES